MSRYCVVVAEGSRARFFTLEKVELPELESGPNLVEQRTMVNPEHQAHADVLWTDRMGRNRSPNGQSHRYDDHRSQRDEEMERRFARDIARELESMTRANGTRRVVLCAEKRMLGFLRRTIQGNMPSDVDLQEIAKDLAKLTPHQLHERLAREGRIPRRTGRNGH